MRPLSVALGFVFAAVLFVTTSVLTAWSGASSAPPSGNVSAPVNVSATDQIKNGGIGVNSLAVFGNAILSGVSNYLNFGDTAGVNGYGFRDNAGTMELKNNNGSWAAIATSPGSGESSSSLDIPTKPPGWPTGIVCTLASGHPYVFFYAGQIHSVGVHAYSSIYGTGFVSFNTNGAYATAYQSYGDCDNKSISQIQTAGMDF